MTNDKKPTKKCWKLPEILKQLQKSFNIFYEMRF